MKLLTAPTTSASYPELAAESVMAVRMKLGMSHISLNYGRISDHIAPTLVVDFFNNKGKLYTLRYNLPPDRLEQTERECSEFCVTVKTLQRNYVIQSPIKING